MNSAGDALDPLRSMINGIETRYVGKQNLCSADVAVGFLTAYMLLAGLQRHAISLLASSVSGDPNDPPWNSSFVIVACCEEGRMGATIAHRDPEALGASEYDISPHFSRRLEQSQAHQIGSHQGDGFMPMELLGCCAEIDEVAQHRGVLKEGTEQLGAVDLLEIAYYQFKAKTRCAGFKDVDGLGEARGIHVEFVGSPILAHALGKSHAFGRRSCFVKQRGVCQLHAGEIQDHLLVVQQTFKSALRYLWLVGCVGGIPTRILQQIS